MLFSFCCSGCHLLKRLQEKIEETAIRLENRYNINLDTLVPKRNGDSLKIIMQVIDGIKERPIYDELIERIKPGVADKALQDHPDQVLKEQHLLRQPEWR